MLQLKKHNKLVTAPVSPNLQAETFTRSAHGTYVRHPNVISPPRTDSLRLLQRYSLREMDSYREWTPATSFQNKIYTDNRLRSNLSGNQTNVLDATVSQIRNLTLWFSETRNRRDVSSRINSSVLKGMQEHCSSKRSLVTGNTQVTRNFIIQQ